MMWWFLSVGAFAGEIEVEMQTPVLFKVDGELVNDLGAVNRATGLTPGVHTVTAENLLGRTVATLEVEVPVTERVTVRYAKKALTIVGRRELVTTNAIPIELSGGSSSTTRPLVVKDAVSYAFTGLSPSSHRLVLGGAEVPYVKSLQAFTVVDLPVGSPVELAFHADGKHVRTDPFTTSAPGHYMCDLAGRWGEPLEITSCVRSGDAYTAADRARWAR